MRRIRELTVRMMAILAAVITLNGCATLAVTPLQTPKPEAGTQPVVVGLQVTGERLRKALSDPEESAVLSTSGKAFTKVSLLPPDARNKTAPDLLASYGADYVLTATISDISVNGNLNPLWFASIPLLFFKPYAPIVTFEAVVTLEATARDARTGAVVLQREITEVATDHFSPMEPQAKVRKLISRGINNAFVTILDELRGKLPTGKLSLR